MRLTTFALAAMLATGSHCLAQQGQAPVEAAQPTPAGAADPAGRSANAPAGGLGREEIDIFIEPPREAFGLGLVAMWEGKVFVTVQNEVAVQAACGVNFGCLSQLEDGTCQIHVWTGLPDALEKQALRNMVARCAGWTPPGE